MLTPCPPGPDERKTSTRSSSSLTFDLDVVDLRGHRHRGEARLAPLGGVEGRDADQAVHAGLAAQVAVGVLAGHLDGRRLDPGLFAGQQVDDLGLEPRALTPAQVHAHEHLRPVLRLGAARARDGWTRSAALASCGPDSMILSSNSSSSRAQPRQPARRSRHRGCRRRRPPGPARSARRGPRRCARAPPRSR